MAGSPVSSEALSGPLCEMLGVDISNLFRLEVVLEVGCAVVVRVSYFSPVDRRRVPRLKEIIEEFIMIPKKEESDGDED